MPHEDGYQDAAIRDALKSGAIALAFSALAILCWVASEDARMILEPLPFSRHGNDYEVVLTFLAVMAVACWAVSLGILATSPAQHERFAAKNARYDPAQNKSRRSPDPADAAYHTPIWRYWIERHRRV